MKLEEFDVKNPKPGEYRMWVEVFVDGEWVVPLDYIEISKNPLRVLPTKAQLDRYKEGIRIVRQRSSISFSGVNIDVDITPL